MPDTKLAAATRAQAALRERVNMTLKVDPTVMITFRGKDHILEFDNRAILSILEATGVNLLTDGFGDKGAYLRDPFKLSHFIFHALKGNWPELTYAESLGLYSMRHTLYVWTKLGEALSYIQPELSETEIIQAEAPPNETPTREQIVNGLPTTDSPKF